MCILVVLMEKDICNRGYSGKEILYIYMTRKSLYENIGIDS